MHALTILDAMVEMKLLNGVLTPVLVEMPAPPPFTSLCGRGARQGQAAAAVRLRAALTRTLTRPRILPILLT